MDQLAADFQPTALTTVDVMRPKLLGVGTTDTSQDDEILRTIYAVSAQIEEYCNRILSLQTYTEQLSGYGRLRLDLSQYPVRSVASVSISGQQLSEGTDFTVLRAEGQLYAKQGWQWQPGQFTVAGPSFFDLTQDPDGLALGLNVLVVYAAGYVTPAQAKNGPPRTLPYSLEEACVRGVLWSWERDPGVLKEQTPGGYRIEVYPDAVALIEAAGLKGILKRHKRFDRPT